MGRKHPRYFGQSELTPSHSPATEHTEIPSMLVSPGFVINKVVLLESRDISVIPVASSVKQAHTVREHLTLNSRPASASDFKE